jgi:hypothetical protein
MSSPNSLLPQWKWVVMKLNDTYEKLTPKRGEVAFMAVNIFFCYAHEDEDLLNKLKRL